MMHIQKRAPEKAVSLWMKYLGSPDIEKNELLWNLYLTSTLQARYSKEFIEELLQEMSKRNLKVLPWSVKSVLEYRNWLVYQNDDIIKLP